MRPSRAILTSPPLVMLVLSPLLVDAYCLVGQSCFPSSAELAAFNASVGGNLFAQRPMGAVCYKEDPLYDPTLCQAEYSSFYSDQWLSDHSESYQYSNFAACGVAVGCDPSNPLNSTLPCFQGNVPDYTVHARNPDHVVSYMNFAVKYNLPIVVKNTGHDHKGRSAGKGGFALWTHLLNTTSRNPAFVPQGCSSTPQDSVTLGAGVQWRVAYQYAASQNVTLVGGDGAQVGAGGGWLLGGGHSFLSPSFGLGVDNLLEMDIVTPNGTLQTISECSNPDLFWAVRGGGGATFGIITSVTYKAHPPVSIAAIIASTSSRIFGTNDTSVIVNALAQIAPRLGDLGVGGLFSTSTYSTTDTYVVFVLPNGSAAELANATASFFQSTQGIWDIQYNPSYPTFYDFYSSLEAADSPSGSTASLSSRLIPRSYFTSSELPKLVTAVQAGQTVLRSLSIPLLFQIIYAPPAKAGLSVDQNKTSVNPIWYESLWHVIYASAWEAHGFVSSAADPLRLLTPEAGAYQNEADVYEPNHQQSFWGANYNRLASIKNEIDPDTHMQVWQGVGYQPLSSIFQCYYALI